MFGRRVFGAGILGLLVLAAGLAQAQTTPKTIYVDATNGEGQDGSIAAPFRTIAAAIALVTPNRGDTILVRRGTYSERINVPEGTLLTSDTGATNTFIVGTPSIPADLVTLERASTLRGFSVGETGGAAVRVPVNGSAEITNCVLYASESGVRIEVNGLVECINNTIYNNLTGLSVGAGGKALPFKNNIVAENNTGIFVGDGGSIQSSYSGSYNNAVLITGADPGNSDFPSNPLFVNAQNLNFHLRDVSNMRDRGDPNQPFNDRDGTRNDVGADGGPFGALDTLAPQVFIESNPKPAEGEAPLSVLFDARSSADEWGIASWQWDFDAKDGISVEGFGASVPVLYNTPGGYIVTLTVTDNSGFSSTAAYPVRVGNPPDVSIESSPKAGPAPLTVNFAADVRSGDGLFFAWDFDSDGVTDAEGISPQYAYPAGTAPGLYVVTLTATDSEGVITQVQSPVTVTEFPVVASANLSAGATAVIIVNDAQSPINGAKVTVPTNAVSRPLAVAIGAPTASELPLKPAGNIAALISVSPSGVTFTRGVHVEVPIPANITDLSGLKVTYYDPTSQAWFGDGISSVSVKEGTPKVVEFDTAHFTTFAVTLNNVPVPPKQLACGPGGGATDPRGDWLLVLGLCGLLAASRIPVARRD